MLQLSAPGKWILAGEHAVLRGHPALVFPLKSLSMKLEFLEGNSPLEIGLEGRKGQELKLLVSGIFEAAVERLGRPRSELTGKMTLKSDLPLGAGLGASAALCSLVTLWCVHRGWLPDADKYDFARSLEDLFHGESSGVDVAVALSQEGLRFVRGGERKAILPLWQPALYLSYCGQRGVTSECVQKVKALWNENTPWAKSIDERMAKAVGMAEEALCSVLPDIRLGMLAEAMGMAGSCFVDWDLVDGSLRDHLHELRAAGAIAVKPTGSGGGGYVLSLWKDQPKSSLADRLIPCFTV